LFEALNLTNAQREAMERIKKELELEFVKHAEIYSRNAALILERVNAAIRERQAAQIPIGGVGAEAQKGLEAFIRELEAEPEHKKLLDESYASSKAFATLFRTRMFEILNDEQRRRLQELIDNPPPHAQVLIQRLKRENWGRHEEGSKSEGTSVGTDRWIPGPDSWQPGDPLHEEFRQEQRDSRFPRQAN